MTPIVAFILGLLIGWVIEWIIDWLFWRKRFAALQAELDQAKAAHSSGSAADTGLEGQLAAMADYTSLQEKNTRLQADKATLNQQILALTQEKTALAEQLAACRGKLTTAEAPTTVPATRAVQLTKDPAAAAPLRAPAAASEPDELEIIKGIGPVIKRKLNQGGIYTFEQLAALTPVTLREIVGDVIQRLADEDAIISQAKEYAAKKAGGG